MICSICTASAYERTKEDKPICPTCAITFPNLMSTRCQCFECIEGQPDRYNGVPVPTICGLCYRAIGQTDHCRSCRLHNDTQATNDSDYADRRDTMLRAEQYKANYWNVVNEGGNIAGRIERNSRRQFIICMAGHDSAREYPSISAAMWIIAASA